MFVEWNHCKSKRIGVDLKKKEKGKVKRWEKMKKDLDKDLMRLRDNKIKI